MQYVSRMCLGLNLRIHSRDVIFLAVYALTDDSRKPGCPDERDVL
jgi:hypothetical protein